MNILYMGYFCNEQLFNSLVEKGSNSSHARQQLENKLLRGLIANMSQGETISVVSYLPNLLVSKRKGEIWNGIAIKYLWCNKKNVISVIRCIFSNARSIISWCKAKTSKIVLIYSVNPLHAIPALFLRRWLKYKVITLCPEVSVYRKNDKKQIVSLISRKIEHWLDNSFDGYIVLTEFMNEIVNLKKKPYLVMEGIADTANDTKGEEKTKAILYAGGLNKENGIEILLQAFSQLENYDWQLWICGSGESEKKIKAMLKWNSNIIFYGIVPNEKVIELEKRAILLINPRLTTNAFTRYSFPSKTIEYMASGTATIITRLEGIPDEYFEYVYVWEDETVLGLSQFLKELFAIDIKKHFEKGKEAQRFVLENKNIEMQGQRIVNFLYMILDNESGI